MAEEIDYEQIEQRLGYRFCDRERLITALTHSSYANENPGQAYDNETMEFLGDAVLDLVIGHMLMTAFPSLREGQLSVTRAQIVSETGLSAVARELGLGQWLLLGKGERVSGGQDKSSLLANAFEAVVAAVYLDGGFEAAFALISRLFTGRVKHVEVSGYYDHKTRLQERAQALLKTTPRYQIIAERGPDHAKVFEVQVSINGKPLASAEGRSKKAAEQSAAAAAAFVLEGADLGGLLDGSGTK